MTWRGIQVSVTRTVTAITFLFTIGAGAATIAKLNTTPNVVLTNSALLGLPVAVAVDQSGHIYVMTYRGWIYPLNNSLVVQGSGNGVKMPGANTANNSVDFPAVALAANVNTGDVYAARNNGTILHYNLSLSLQQQTTVTTTATNRLAGLTVDGSGNYIYAATAGGQIVEFNPSLVSQATGAVTVPTGKSVAAIKADTTGNLWIAISDGTIYRLNSSLQQQATGSVTGTPVGIATDPSTGNAIVATSNNGLYNVNQSMVIVNQNTSLTNLAGVDLDSAGHMTVSDSAGTVYVMNTSFSSTSNNTSSGISPARSIAIDTTGSIYVVGGLAGKSEGDPHLTTINGVRYDFQSAGEFVLIRHTGDTKGSGRDANVGGSASHHDAMEIQVRQYPVATTANTCVSLNSAVAARLGRHKVTYEPNLSGQPDPSGLQLRIDGKLITLSPNGMGLGEGGRIVPTSASGGLEVDFPDDTVLFVTPGWWASQSKWYLNVNVVPQERAGGLVGNVPDGSWLPALPDGTSIGAKPTSTHDQYVELYERFADAWRVTDKSSLFDYAPGTSTATFTMPGWPPESGACTIPGAVPAEGASEEVAREACKGVPGDPANCIFDVKVTGLTNIANTYVASRNVQPVQETTKPECHCEREAGGGTFALLTFLGLLALWILSIQARRRRTT
jgi:hypothetical protein